MLRFVSCVCIFILAIIQLHETAKNDNAKWKKQLELFAEASSKLSVECTSNCSCFRDIWETDLYPFRQDGIIEPVIRQAETRGVLYQIVDHRLFRQKECMFPARCEGVEYFILRIIKHLKDTEFVLNTRDWPQAPKPHGDNLPVFSFSKTDTYYDIMYPAWTFWAGGPAIKLYPTGIGRWDLMREKLRTASKEYPWHKKEGKAFFRGSRTSAERDPLIRLSRNKPEVVDAAYTKNQAWRSIADSLGENPVEEVALEDHCRFKYLFNFRGVAASFRLKHLFLCGSLVFHVGDEWQEFFYPLLVPWYHYIPVKQDLSDAEKLIQFAIENDDVAREIAERGEKFIWHTLTMDNVECYWKNVLSEYTKLLKYDVKRNPKLIQVKAKSSHDEL